MRILGIGLLAVLPVLASWLPCQEAPDPEPEDGVVRVTIEVLAEGDPQPRVKGREGGPEVEEFRLDGRRLAWRLADRSFTDAQLLQRALKAIAADPARRVDDARNPGRKVVPPCVVEPAVTCRWKDVVWTVDLALEAGFEEVYPAGLDARPTWWLSVSVEDPVLGDGAHVVPEARYCLPDEPAPDDFRTTVHISQRGIVRLGEEVLVRPGEPDAVDRLTPRLTDQAERAAAEQRIVDDGSGAPNRLDADFLVHADCWAPWPVVRRVVRVASTTEPRFWRIKYAVGEYDFEARLKKGERF